MDGEVFCPVCGARSAGTLTGRQPDTLDRSPDLLKLERASEGRLEFIRALGRGGMGTVFLAREVDLDRLVAVKALSTHWLTHESMVERFRREARVIASLRHPSIVHVHSVGKAEDLHYFVMDYIDGVSLGDILRAHGPLTIPAAQALFFQVGSALSYAHGPGRGVIHRDVKPSNIMVDGEGNAFVTDFGISKVVEGQAGLTMTGLIMGTPEFMSPEQCRGDTATVASDQYALGVVLFSLLAGTPPFTGPHYTVLTGHTLEPPPPVHELRPDCPPELSEVVDRMLKKQPDERWPDIWCALEQAGVKPLMPQDPARDDIIEAVTLTRIGESDERARLWEDDVREEGSSDPQPTTIRIVAPQQALEPGDEVQLRATSLFESGEEIEGGPVTWDSTDPKVARIDSITGGLVAVGAGSAVITAWTAGVSQSVAIKVVPPRVHQLTIEPDWVELEIGATKRLSATARSKQGDTLDAPVIWSSSDPTTATIGEEGNLRGYQLGSVTILAQCQGVGTSCEVSVIPPAVASVQLFGVPNEILCGESAALTLKVLDARGQYLDRPTFWSNSDPEVATIGEGGEFLALSPGRTTISAECGGQTASATVTVLPVPVARIEFANPKRMISVGEEVDLHVGLLGAAGQPLDREVEWRSGDPSVLEVRSDGRVKGLAAGSAEIVAMCGEVVASITIQVEAPKAVFEPFPPLAPEVESPEAPSPTLPEAEGSRPAPPTPPSAKNLGEIVVPTPTQEQEGSPAPIPPDGGSDVRIKVALWALPVIAVLVGSWFWLKPDPLATPPVEAPVPATVRVETEAGIPTVPVLELATGDTVGLMAMVSAADGSPLPGQEVVWSSTNSELASVDSDGQLIALAAGSLTIGASVGEVTRQVPVLVSAPANEPEVAEAETAVPEEVPTDVDPGPSQEDPAPSQEDPEPTQEDPAPSAAEPPPPNGVLVLDVGPRPGRVEIDEEPEEEILRHFILSLSPGQHTLRIEIPNLMPVDTVFEITSGDTTRIRKTLQRKR